MSDLLDKEVCVTWRDPCAMHEAHGPKDWKPLKLTHTYGKVVEETPELLRVASELIEDPEAPYCCTSTIDQGLIESVRVLQDVGVLTGSTLGMGT